MGYNFKDLFYYLFQDKKNKIYAFSTGENGSNTIFNFCLLFHLSKINSLRMNRLLGNKLKINRITRSNNSQLMDVLNSRFTVEGIVPSQDCNLFENSFNDPVVLPNQQDVVLNYDSNYDSLDIIVIPDTLTRVEYEQIKERNKKSKLPIFIKWVESAEKLGQVFPEAILVNNSNLRKNKDHLLLNVIKDGKIIKNHSL
jgi:hypothetical protein